MKCAICSCPVERTSAPYYHLGKDVCGRLCPGCRESMSDAITRWIGKRLRELQADAGASDRARVAEERLAVRSANEMVRVSRGLQKFLGVRASTAAE